MKFVELCFYRLHRGLISYDLTIEILLQLEPNIELESNLREV